MASFPTSRIGLALAPATASWAAPFAAYYIFLQNRIVYHRLKTSTFVVLFPDLLLPHQLHISANTSLPIDVTVNTFQNHCSTHCSSLQTFYSNSDAVSWVTRLIPLPVLRILSTSPAVPSKTLMRTCPSRLSYPCLPNSMAWIGKPHPFLCPSPALDAFLY